jgi:hypothetical protein
MVNKATLISSILFVIFISLVSCTHKVEPTTTSTEILDLTIDSTVIKSDVWIMVVDQSGNLLTTKQWQKETDLKIAANIKPGENVDLIFFQGSKSTTAPVYDYLQVYTNIQPGRVWKMGRASSGITTANSGPLNVEIQNIPYPYSQNPGMMLAAQGVTYLGGSGQGSSNDYNWNFNWFYSNESTLFSFTPGNAYPVYLVTDTLKSGKSYVYDFTKAFKTVDNVISLPQPINAQVSCSISGVKANQLYWQSGDWPCTPSSTNSFETGFNNGYDQYYAQYDASLNGKSFNANVVGKTFTSDQFTFPAKDFTVTSNNIFSFAFSVDATDAFTIHTDSWSKQTTVNSINHTLFVSVYGDKSHGGLSLKKLPDELTSKYSFLGSLTDLSYTQSTFLFSNNGYQDYTESVFAVTPTTTYQNSWSMTK